jgi:hypothetical protein
MISLRKIGIAAALAALSATVSLPAVAATSVAADLVEMCSPPGAGPTWAKSVVNPSSGGGTYSLNTKGCAIMAIADVAYFRSQGFTQGGGLGALYAGPFTAQSTTANSPTLPANAYIETIIVQETTGNAITGGLDVGVAGSSDATIVSAFAVGANAVINIPSASILKKVFPTSGTTGPAAQQIFFNAHTNWTDAASINVTILYRYY